MEIAEWNELENRMNSQKGVNWMWCTLRMKGSWSCLDRFCNTVLLIPFVGLIRLFTER